MCTGIQRLKAHRGSDEFRLRAGEAHAGGESSAKGGARVRDAAAATAAAAAAAVVGGGTEHLFHAKLLRLS